MTKQDYQEALDTFASWEQGREVTIDGVDLKVSLEPNLIGGWIIIDKIEHLDPESSDAARWARRLDYFDIEEILREQDPFLALDDLARELSEWTDDDGKYDGRSEQDRRDEEAWAEYLRLKKKFEGRDTN